MSETAIDCVMLPRQGSLPGARKSYEPPATRAPTLHKKRKEPSMDQAVRPSRSDVEAAFRTIIRWTGDNPDRQGLVDTPSRMARAYEEYFRGYDEDPEAILLKTFEETKATTR